MKTTVGIGNKCDSDEVKFELIFFKVFPGLNTFINVFYLFTLFIIINIVVTVI